jgi:hypothetical protein
MKQILEGVHYIHTHNIIHLDLKVRLLHLYEADPRLGLEKLLTFFTVYDWRTQYPVFKDMINDRTKICTKNQQG